MSVSQTATCLHKPWQDGMGANHRKRVCHSDGGEWRTKEWAAVSDQSRPEPTSRYQTAERPNWLREGVVGSWYMCPVGFYVRRGTYTKSRQRPLAASLAALRSGTGTSAQAGTDRSRLPTPSSSIRLRQNGILACDCSPPFHPAKVYVNTLRFERHSFSTR